MQNKEKTPLERESHIDFDLHAYGIFYFRNLVILHERQSTHKILFLYDVGVFLGQLKIDQVHSYIIRYHIRKITRNVHSARGKARARKF